MKLLGGLALVAMLATQGASSVVAGWTLSDPPSPTDNGSKTVVQIKKTAPGVELIYVAFAGSEGGTVSVDFAARGKCRDQWFGSRITFDDPDVKDEVDVRGQIHEAFGKYIAKCGAPAMTESDVMRGFGEAFAAVERRVNAAGASVVPTNASTEACIAPGSATNGVTLVTFTGKPAQLDALLADAGRYPRWSVDADKSTDGIRSVRLKGPIDMPYRDIGGLVYLAQMQKLEIGISTEPRICGLEEKN